MTRSRLLLLALALALGLGLLWQHACQGPEPGALRARRQPNVVLIVIDTLRGDMLCGPAGEPAEMPYARRLAERGVLFTDVTAPAPWTVPSMASLLTGAMPRDHGVMRMVPVPRLPAGVGTWAQAFGRAGYRTAAYSGSPWAMHGADGLFKGFDNAAERFGLDRAPTTLQPWRRSLARNAPFFVLLHTFEAHDPYGEENNRYRTVPAGPAPGFDALAPREPWEWARHFMLSRAERKSLELAHGPAFQHAVMRYLWSGYRSEPRPELAAELKQAYIEGVRWVDGLLRTTVEWLESEGLLEDTFLVVTSDHGEAFGEHGTIEHGRILHQEVLHVPLLIVGPGDWTGGRVVREHVSLMDLMPTLAEAAGVSPPPGAVGASLRPLLAGPAEPRVALAYELVNFEVAREDLEIQLRAARTARQAAILEWDVRRGTLREHAYDRVADRAEARDLAQGRGTLEGVALDPDLCRAVEALRQELVADGLTAPLPPPCSR